MKKVYLYILSSFIFLLSCGPKSENPTDMVKIDKDNLPEMKFEEDVFDFGTITQGEKVTHDFKFENTGESDLIISNAYGSCGCTVPEVPKQPIAAGDENIIRVTFDSKGKSGMVTKDVTIVTNCMPNSRIIKIKGNIFVPKTQNSITP